MPQKTNRPVKRWKHLAGLKTTKSVDRRNGLYLQHNLLCQVRPLSVNPPQRETDIMNPKRVRRAAYKRIPFAALRGLPADPTHRVSIAHYQILPALNPNGSPRPERMVSHASLTLGSDFRVDARIVQQPSGLALEISPDGFDMERRKPELFAFSPALTRSIYDAMAQAHTLAKARQHSQSREGRN